MLRPSLLVALWGAVRLSFTARIGRAQFHRARSASKKDGLAIPAYPFQACPFLSPAGGPIGLLMRASNDTNDPTELAHFSLKGVAWISPQLRTSN